MKPLHAVYDSGYVISDIPYAISEDLSRDCCGSAATRPADRLRRWDVVVDMFCFDVRLRNLHPQIISRKRKEPQ